MNDKLSSGRTNFAKMFLDQTPVYDLLTKFHNNDSANNRSFGTATDNIYADVGTKTDDISTIDAATDNIPISTDVGTKTVDISTNDAAVSTDTANRSFGTVTDNNTRSFGTTMDNIPKHNVGVSTIPLVPKLILYLLMMQLFLLFHLVPSVPILILYLLIMLLFLLFCHVPLVPIQILYLLIM